jgi:hypothetical protein
MENWISVNDKLPELDVPVWCHDAETKRTWVGGITDADDNQWAWGNAYGSMWQQKDGTWSADLEWDDEYNVTHWQSLPLPPNP